LQGQRQQNKQKCKAIKSSPAEHNGISHIKHEQRHDFDFFACLLSISPSLTLREFETILCGEKDTPFLGYFHQDNLKNSKNISLRHKKKIAAGTTPFFNRMS